MKALILAHPGDRTAGRVARALRARQAFDAIIEVSIDQLVHAPVIAHRIGAVGIRTDVVVRGGARIASDDVDVVFNRLRSVEVPRFRRAPKRERDYAASEMFALLVSWLTSLPCPVINPAGATALSGAARHPFEWHRLAAAAGLPVPMLHVTSSPRRFPPDRLARIDGETMLANEPGWFGPRLTGRVASALAIAGDVTGDAPIALAPAIRRLASTAGLTVARCDFVEPLDAPGDWLFAGMDPCPDVDAEDDVARIAAALESAAASARAEPVGS